MQTAVMEKQNNGTSRAVTALRRVVTALALTGWLAVALLGGRSLSPITVIVFGLCCMMYLILPGWALADWLAPRQKGLTGLFAAVYGCALLAGLHCISVRLGAVWLLRTVPPLLAAVWLYGKHRSGTLDVSAAAKGALRTLDSNTGLFWALLCLLYAMRFGAVNPYPANAGAVHLDPDMLWNVGNAAALSSHFPAEDIRFSGVLLSYHYLTELLAAALGLVSGVQLYDIYVFLAGPLFLAGELVALKALARAYFGKDNPRAGRLMILLLFGFSCLSMWKVIPNGLSLFGNTLLQHLVTNINAQATALVFLCAFTVSFIRLSRSRFAPNGKELLMLFVSFFLLCVAKGPEAAIVVCAFGVTMLLVLVFQKPHYLTAFACLAGIVAVFAVTYFVLFASGSGSVQFTIYAMRNYWAYRVLSPYTEWLCAHLPISGYVWLFLIGVADVFLMLPLQFLLWLSDVPHALRRLFRLDPARIMANGVVVGGFLGYHLFYHSSSSQVYFALVAMIYMTLLAVEPLQRLLQSKHKILRLGVCFVGAAALCTTLFMVGCYTVKGARCLAATAGLCEGNATQDYWTAGDAEAMEWLQAHSDKEQLFATNRTSHTPDSVDAISNGYSAMSGCPAYLEGWTYAMTNMGVELETIYAKMDVNAELFSGCSEERAAELAAQNGIRWLVLAKRWQGEGPQDMPAVFENADVAIYEFNS